MTPGTIRDRAGGDAEGDQHADHEEQSKAAHHRHRRDQQREETGRCGQRGDRRRPTRGAGAELNAVIDREAEHHREHRHVCNRERTTEHCGQPEGDGDRSQGRRQRQQAQAAPEHGEQDQRHDHDRNGQQQGELAADLTAQVGEQHRLTGNRVAQA